MKVFALTLAFLFAAAVTLSSCVPNPVNNEQPNSLVASPRVLHLAQAGATDSSKVALTCGCPFELDSIFFLGDTNSIKYTLSEPLSRHVTPHTIHFTVPAGVTGSHSAMMALYVLDDNNLKFYDTIRVSIP